MYFNDKPTRYSRPIILLHWLTLLLLIGVYAFIEGREFFPKGTEMRELMKTMHYMLGLTVFLAVMLRVLFRLGSRSPRIDPPPGWLSQQLAAFMHLALYLLMIGMPIAGWLMLSAAGKPIPFYGLELPALIDENKSLADSIKSLHKTAGNVGYLLIAAHAVAGLYHHYIKRDNTLKRMLP